MFPKLKDQRIPRWQFAVGTAALLSSVLFFAYASSKWQQVELPMRGLLVGIAVLQALLVRWREADIAPRRRWRTKYAFIWVVIAAFAVMLPHQYSTKPTHRFNMGLAGVYFFALTPLALPLIISCLVQKSGAQQNRQSVTEI